MPLSPASSQPVTLATDLGVTGANPTPFVFLNPLAGSVMLANVIVDYTASAVVGTRVVQITVNDENGNRRLFVRSKGLQIAGQTILHPFVQGDTIVVVLGTTFSTTIPRGFYLRKDWVIIFSSNLPLVGDTQRIMFQLLR